ncbi:hypothetical protein BDV95DRAFT_380659 [Massariosphaeria phaeospora]|uniref:Uncharacterized protein n=1 Tax=Massariosphaeria phaeospora TaxID=100035 RepID=A0A7C8MQ14_9PLEO|nr:hypothetical protein BDV95DRAFT_380659 [Massariosphaeria phaeospora]
MKFRHHVAEVAIDLDKWTKEYGGKRPHVFLMLLDDMPKLARLLRIMDLANFLCFHFKFTLRQPRLALSPPNSAVQKKLLLPFEQVRGTAAVQTVSIVGPVDAALSAHVKQAMTQHVAWLRGGVCEIYELALSMKRKGDVAFRMGNTTEALTKYESLQTFVSATTTKNTKMKSDPDQLRAFQLLGYMTMTDIITVFMTDLTTMEMDKRAYGLVTDYLGRIEVIEKTNDLYSKDEPGFLHSALMSCTRNIFGVAELGLNHPIKAGKAFATAFKLFSHPAYRTGWETAKAWSGLTQRDRQTHLTSLHALLPSQPLEVPELKPYSMPAVAPEHWVMRRLGFQGPIPYREKVLPGLDPTLVLTAEPNSDLFAPAVIGHIRPEVLTAHAEDLDQTVVFPDGRRFEKRRLIIWVGLEETQLGAERLPDGDAQKDAMLARIAEGLVRFAEAEAEHDPEWWGAAGRRGMAGEVLCREGNHFYNSDDA